MFKKKKTTVLKYISTPASLQDNPDVLEDDGMTELKLQTKRYLEKGVKNKNHSSKIINYHKSKKIKAIEVCQKPRGDGT